MRLATQFLVILILLGRTPLLQATMPGGELTLEQAISIALESNRDVQNAGLEVRKAQNQAAISRTYRLPSFSSYVFGGHLLSHDDLRLDKGSLGTVEGIGPLPSEDVTIQSPGGFSALIVNQINQPITQLYRIGLGVKQAEIGVEIAEQKLRAEQHNVTASVKNAYYALLQTQSNLRVVEQNILLMRELDRVTDQYVLQRVSLKSDSLEVKTRLARTELDILTLQDLLVSQKEHLNSLLGRDLLTDFTVAPVSDAEMISMDLSSAQSTALAQRPEIRQARLTVDQAELDRRSKKSEFIPDISLSLSNTSPIHYSDVMPGNVTTLGVTMNWNIFDWGRKKRELQSKDASIQQARNVVDDAESLVIREVNANYRKLQRTVQMLRVAALAQETAVEALRVTTNSYKFDAALFKDILQSQSTLEQANDEYQQALLSFWTAKSEFDKSLGEDHD